MKIDFEHRQAAHCENGVISNLLNYHGIQLSEPMIFGIGAGIYFVHMTFLKIDGIPLTAFRSFSGKIFQRAINALDIEMDIKTFNLQYQAMAALDKNLEKGIPTGMVVGAFHLAYFPASYRFHFNAHNIVGYGKENGHYLISDPVFEDVKTLSYEELKKVRFSMGKFKPKGKMYYIKKVPETIDIEKAVRKGLKTAAFYMVKLKGPIVGVYGMRLLSKKLRKYPEKLDNRMAARYVANIVRMAEEIGTGGAGFRFLYAAFLQEAAGVLNNNQLADLSGEMTKVGDQWRDFSVLTGRLCKGRAEKKAYNEAADKLYQISIDEEKIFNQIHAIVK